MSRRARLVLAIGLALAMTEAARGQDALLGDGHLLRLAAHELDAAGGAARIAVAGVQLIDVGVVLQGQHQAFALRHIEFADTFDR
jgi:hypothetical protein